MSLDTTKHDIALNNQAYRVRGYVKSEAPAFVPRVASGGQSETEFNMLLSKTIDGFIGGSLQRLWKDDQSVFATENLYPIYEDGTLYPVNAPTTLTTLGSSRPIVLARTRTRDYLYIAWGGTTGGAPQGIKRVDQSGTIVDITIPANINSSRPVTDMVIWNNELWVSANNPSAGSLYRMAVSSTTLTEITGGDAATYFYKMVVFKNQLYGTNVDTRVNHALSRYTGNTTTKSYAVLATTPQATPSYFSRLFIFNNRIHLTRNDGLFAYDGTQLAQIADLSEDVNDDNFRHATVLKGYMYYFMPDGFYRYNGALIDKLYDISEIGMPNDMSSGKNRLWMTFANSSYSGSSRYDKSMGYDFAATSQIDGRVMVYNGKALYTYARLSTTTKSGSPLVSNEGEVDLVTWFADTLYISTTAEPSNTQYKISTVESALTGNKAWRIATSIFDGGFAMVDKNLDNIEIVLDGVTSTDQTIGIEYRTSGFAGSTGWVVLGTFSTTTKLKEQIFRTLPNGVVFRRIQFRIAGTTEAGSGIAKIVLRYTLSPDFKWQWAFTLLAYGDDPLAPLMLADSSKSTTPIATLRGAVYAARASDTPVVFVDIDKLDLNGAINNSVTTIALNTTALLKGDNGLVQIDDEIMYWSAKTATTLTVVRAQLGTTAASHADNAAVYAAYRVMVTSITGERIDTTDTGIDQEEDKSRATEISLQIREV